MKKLLVALLFLSSSVFAAEIRTSWDAVPFAIDGYRVHYILNGATEEITIEVPFGTNQHTILDVAPGHYELWVEGYLGTDSGESNRVSVFYIGDIILSVQFFK